MPYICYIALPYLKVMFQKKERNSKWSQKEFEFVTKKILAQINTRPRGHDK